MKTAFLTQTDILRISRKIIALFTVVALIMSVSVIVPGYSDNLFTAFADENLEPGDNNPEAGPDSEHESDYSPDILKISADYTVDDEDDMVDDDGGFAATAAVTCGCIEPKFNQEFYTEGDGSTITPFQITTAEQLNHAREHLDKSFIVINNIEIPAGFNSLAGTTYGWHPIGDNSGNNTATRFRGNFDGGGFTITGLASTKETDYVGLFGYIYANAAM